MNSIKVEENTLGSQSKSLKMGNATSKEIRSLTTTTSPRSKSTLAISVRVLFRYLEKVDVATLDLAKKVLNDCERKHYTRDSKFETLADAINERVRNAVGEKHWENTKRIQLQLAYNRGRKQQMMLALELQRLEDDHNARLTDASPLKRSLTITCPRYHGGHTLPKKSRSENNVKASDCSIFSESSCSSLTVSGKESSTSTAPSTSSAT